MTYAMRRFVIHAVVLLVVLGCSESQQELHQLRAEHEAITKRLADAEASVKAADEQRRQAQAELERTRAELQAASDRLAALGAALDKLTASPPEIDRQAEKAKRAYALLTEPEKQHAERLRTALARNAPLSNDDRAFIYGPGRDVLEREFVEYASRELAKNFKDGEQLLDFLGLEGQRRHDFFFEPFGDKMSVMLFATKLRSGAALSEDEIRSARENRYLREKLIELQAK